MRAATNRPLAAEVAAGRFWADLYFRLNVISVRMPPLRERPEDVGPLVRFCASQAARECLRPEIEVSEAAIAALAARPWPGSTTSASARSSPRRSTATRSTTSRAGPARRSRRTGALWATSSHRRRQPRELALQVLGVHEGDLVGQV